LDVRNFVLGLNLKEGEKHGILKMFNIFASCFFLQNKNVTKVF